MTPYNADYRGGGHWEDSKWVTDDPRAVVVVSVVVQDDAIRLLAVDRFTGEHIVDELEAFTGTGHAMYPLADPPGVPA